MLRSGAGRVCSLSRNSLRVGQNARRAIANSSNSRSSGDSMNSRASKIFAALAVATVGSIIYGQPYVVKNESAKVPKAPKPVIQTVSVEELEKHVKPHDCWVVIKGKVYDMSDFVDKHPGGADVIVSNAGKDVTKIFEPIHPPDAIANNLPISAYKGDIVGEPEIAEELPDEDELERLDNIENKPALGQVINLHDFEKIAKGVLSKSAWAYYNSGADDEITMRENHYAYQRIYFKPRVLVDVSKVDLSTTMLGCKSSVPFYISATALVKLGHPEGEVAVAKAAGKEGVVQMISTLASCSLEETKAAAIPEQPQWFQLYVNSDREMCKKLIQKAERLGMKALFVTVDAPSLGNREKDKRNKYKPATNIDLGDELDRSQGASRALSTFIDSKLTWSDISWIQSLTKLPVVIKGIQRVEDVIIAAEHGCKGVVLSNHGGRQLDFAPAPIQLLAEVMPVLREKKLDDKIDVFIDGGVRRGTDIMKALCLGAKGVGIGRPVLYSVSSFGENGVRKAMQILKDELEMDMRLVGARNVDELCEDFVDTRFLIGRDAPDMLYNKLYSPLNAVKFNNE